MPGSPLEHSLNLAWLLVCAFLVMFMQLGFAMVETCTRWR
jgi:ammonia channel protein AmtB